MGFIDYLPEKVIIDEVQRAPEIFTSIKASVDNNRKPGRFILTGSANILRLPKLTDSLAGRVEIIHLRFLSQAEIIGRQSSVMQNIFTRTLDQNLKTTGYVKLGKRLNTLITAGGYPSALRRNSENRKLAWHTNRLSRLIKTPKIHLADTGLACALLNIRAEDLDKDRSLLGQLLETYVYQELQKYASWQDNNIDIYHFRNKDKVKVDFVIQDGKYITGLEVKASATVQLSDFKGLIKLRDAVDNSFANGVVFYNGDTILSFGDRLFAIPYAAFLAS